MELLNYFLSFTVSLFAIADPIALTPIFVSITAGFSHKAKSHTIKLAGFTAFTTLVIVLFIGDKILLLFGASLPSFKVAGGLLLMSMAFSLLKTQVSEIVYTEEENKEAEAKTSVGVVPLAIPLLSGPGTISLIIIESQTHKTVEHFSLIIAGIVIVVILTMLFLRTAEPISRKLGTSGLNIFNRIFGMIIAAVAVELIASGLLQLLPGLAG